MQWKRPFGWLPQRGETLMTTTQRNVRRITIGLEKENKNKLRRKGHREHVENTKNNHKSKPPSPLSKVTPPWERELARERENWRLRSCTMDCTMEKSRAYFGSIEEPHKLKIVPNRWKIPGEYFLYHWILITTKTMYQTVNFVLKIFAESFFYQ